MDRDEVRSEAYRRIFEIEDRFVDRDLPRSVLSYFLLLRAIFLADIDEYVAEHGEHPIRVDVAEEGKLKLGWGPLSEFEAELCEMLNGQFEFEDTESGRLTVSERSRASA